MPIELWSEQIWLVQLSDEPALSEDLFNLAERIRHTRPIPDIVLSLGAVTHMNSSNLSQLLRVRKLAIDHDFKLLLAEPSDGVWAMFLTTGLDKVFEFTTDVPTALATLQVTRKT